MITFESVTKTYFTDKHALHDISFQVDPGEFVFLLGPSGSGKTTLLKLILREVAPSTGKIIVAEHDLGELPKKELPHLRRQIGSAFQDFKLIIDKTAYENISLAVEILDKKSKEVKDTTLTLLEKVGLLDKADLFPSQLSGGEVQRVAIARALALDPVLLFADEPTANLDDDTGLQIIKLLNDINQAGTTVIMATHNTKLANKFDHRQIHLKDGQLTKDTKPAQKHETEPTETSTDASEDLEELAEDKPEVIEEPKSKDKKTSKSKKRK